VHHLVHAPIKSFFVLLYTAIVVYNLNPTTTIEVVVPSLFAYITKINSLEEQRTMPKWTSELNLWIETHKIE